MQRRYRLTSSTDFKRVRRFGKSYAHPFVVLINFPNDLEISRFGVSAGKSIGNAVQRNRAKRRLRAVIRPLIPCIQPGWDIVILARRSLAQASFEELQSAVAQLISRAGMNTKQHDI